MSSYNEWVKFAQESKDSALASTLDALSQADRELLFNGKELAFGTAGVRAKVGIGPSLLNVYNVFRIGLAFAETIEDSLKEKGLIVLHDTRAFSKEFSAVIMKAFKAKGIKNIYMYPKNKASLTPMISFFIRKMNLGGGVMVTASHNPPEYQGIKFYNEKGIQIPDTMARQIEARLAKTPLTSFIEIKGIGTRVVEKSYENLFFEMVISLYCKTRLSKGKSNVKVLLTTLQGASSPFIKKLIKKASLNITLVKTEQEPDPRFKIAHSTNPEDFEKAYLNAFNESDQDNYDILCAIDPDGDRLGVVDIKELNNVIESAKDSEDLTPNKLMNNTKEWCLSGNKIGALLLEHVIYATKQKKKAYDFNHFVVRSHVTSDFVDAIAKKNHIDVYETFTGFKWIGEKVESIKDKSVILGFEESIGYFFSDSAREKDSFQAIVVLISLLERLKKKNLTLVQHLNNLYKEYGYYEDTTDNIYAKIDNKDFLKIIDSLKNNPTLKKECKVVNIYDPNNSSKIRILKIIALDKTGWVCLRKSGTEPKIKVYYMFNGTTKIEVHKKLNFFKTLITTIIKDFLKQKD